MLSSILSALALLSVASALPLESDELAQRSAPLCTTYKSGYLAANVNGTVLWSFTRVAIGTEDTDMHRQLEVLHRQQQEPGRVLWRRQDPAQDPVPGTCSLVCPLASLYTC